MSHVALIIGLPGSGKTYLAKTKYVPMGYILVDDPKDLGDTLELVECSRDIVITDPHLCDERVRNECIRFFEWLKYEVECVYFENDEKKCKRLISSRNDGRNIKTFQSFNYTIPPDVVPLKIYCEA